MNYGIPRWIMSRSTGQLPNSNGVCAMTIRAWLDGFAGSVAATAARLAAVVAALTTTAILLAAGLALASGALWFAGVAALLAAFAVARRREPPAASSPTVEGRRVDQWNEVLPIAGAWSTVVGELRAADGLDPWCPTLRRISNNGPHDTEVVSVGHHRPVSLRITRRWFADGIRWRADAGGSVLVGHVRLQPAVTGDHVLAWVHAEAPRCRHSRRALRTIRRETRTRASTLGHNAQHRNPTLSAPRARPGVRTPGPTYHRGYVPTDPLSERPTHPIRRSHAVPPNFTVDLGLGFAPGGRPVRSAVRLARL